MCYQGSSRCSGSIFLHFREHPGCPSVQNMAAVYEEEEEGCVCLK